MRGGIWVLNIFAATWGVAGIIFGALPVWLVVVPVALSAALLLWANRQPVGTGNSVEGDHVGRIVGIASAVEGVAMFLTANVLVNLHLHAAVMPAFAVIVGLHFLLLARFIPVPLYYRTGAALIAVGVIALIVPSPASALVTGFAAAVILWASGIMLARRGRG